MACTIADDYVNKTPVFVIVMKGGLFFAAKLLHQFPINFPFSMEIVSASSYEDSTARVKDVQIEFLNKSEDWANGKDVIILDDVADTFHTLYALRNHQIFSKARSVKTCVLIEKPARREIKESPDYFVQLHSGDDFLVGFGMGMGEHYRHLEFIGVPNLKGSDNEQCDTTSH